MNAKYRAKRRPGMAALLAVLAVLTAACTNGSQAQTADQRNTIDGVNGSVGGNLKLRAIAIDSPENGTYAKGASARLKLVIVNDGAVDDELNGVTSPAFTSWGSFASDAEATAYLDAKERGVTASTVPAAAPSAAPSSAAPPLPLANTAVTVVAKQSVSFGTPTSVGVLLVEGLRQELRPGNVVPITFAFLRAGTVELRVPVELGLTANTATVPAEGGSEGE